MTNKKSHRPPRFMRWLLRRMRSYQEDYLIIGDLEETFHSILLEKGYWFASVWFWGQTFNCILKYIITIICWRITMFKNYLNTALRILQKYKGFSFINIVGLAIGIAVCLLIFLFVENELGFDSHFSDKEHIYRVVTHSHRPEKTEYDSGTPFPTAETLRNDFPDLKGVVQVFKDANMMITVGTDRFKERELLFVEPQFFDIFDTEWILGDAATAMDDPYAVILTQRLANKYFGNSEVVGRVLRLDNEIDLHVTGVVANPPKRTSLPYDLLISWQVMDTTYGSTLGQWDFIDSGTHTYIQFSESFDPLSLEEQFEIFEKKHMEPEYAEKWSFRLQPLADIHFNIHYGSYNYITSRTALFAFSAIGFVILIMACINFINLTTAQAMKRVKEMGIRKVLGADRIQLIRQLLGETSLFTFLSILIALFVVWGVLPYFNQFLGNNTELKLFTNVRLLLFIGSIYIFVSFFNGLYPAFMLSRYQPTEALKERYASHQSRSCTLRNSLVLFQFIISQILIVGTLVIAGQMKFISNMELGFEKNSILNVPISFVRCITMNETRPNKPKHPIRIARNDAL